jgi:hypothetical protein
LNLSLSDTDQLLPLIAAYWLHDNIVGYEPLRLRRQLAEFLSEPAYGCGWLAWTPGALDSNGTERTSSGRYAL